MRYLEKGSIPIRIIWVSEWIHIYSSRTSRKWRHDLFVFIDLGDTLMHATDKPELVILDNLTWCVCVSIRSQIYNACLEVNSEKVKDLALSLSLSLSLHACNFRKSPNYGLRTMHLCKFIHFCRDYGTFFLGLPSPRFNTYKHDEISAERVIQTLRYTANDSS